MLQLGATVILTFALVWLPWASDSPQAVLQVRGLAQHCREAGAQCGRRYTARQAWPRRVFMPTPPPRPAARSLTPVRVRAPVWSALSLAHTPRAWPRARPSPRQVLHRIFPLRRGLYEDYVANFWCTSSVLLKWKQVHAHARAGPRVHPRVACCWPARLRARQAPGRPTPLPTLP